MSDPVRALKKRLRERPDDVDAMSELAARLHESGRTDEGDGWIAKALERAPAHAPSLMLRGYRDLAVGRIDDAATIVERLRATGAPAERVLDLRSRVQIARGELDAAIGSLEEWKRLRPDDPEPLRGLFVALDLAGRSDAAMATAEAALRIDPGDHDLRLEYAEGLEALGRFDRARFEFERVLEDHPDEDSAVAGVARCLAATGRDEEAMETLESFTADCPDATDALLELAWLYRDTGHVADACELLRRLVRKRPDDIDLRIMAARSLYECGDREEALANARKALALDPASVMARGFLASVFTEDGAFDEAERQLLEGLRVHPDDVGLLVVYADLREAEGRLADAESFAIRAVEGEPGVAWTWSCRSRIELRLGKVAEAIESARAGVARDDRHVESHAALGMALAVSGDRDGALAEAAVVAEWDEQLADDIRAAAEHG